VECDGFVTQLAERGIMTPVSRGGTRNMYLSLAFEYDLVFSFVLSSESFFHGGGTMMYWSIERCSFWYILFISEITCFRLC
jgi:hypothetical protein